MLEWITNSQLVSLRLTSIVAEQMIEQCVGPQISSTSILDRDNPRSFNCHFFESLPCSRSRISSIRRVPIPSDYCTVQKLTIVVEQARWYQQ